MRVYIYIASNVRNIHDHRWSIAPTFFSRAAGNLDSIRHTPSRSRGARKKQNYVQPFFNVWWFAPKRRIPSHQGNNLASPRIPRTTYYDWFRWFCKFFPTFYFIFVYDLCDNRTEEEYRHIKANNVRNVTSHPSYDILYLVVVLFSFVLRCILHGRVVNGHTILTSTRSPA